MLSFASWLLSLVSLFTSFSSAQDTPHVRKYFYVGGNYVSDGKGSQYMINQMYVEELSPIAKVLKPHPMVFIHGIGQSGTNWLSTPDNRPGWASYFLAQGYTVYLLDQPSRGRSPWFPNNTTTLTPFTTSIISDRFTAPELPNTYPTARLHTQWPGGSGSGVPGKPAFDAYFSSIVPSVLANVPQQTSMQNAGGTLLERINRPVILIGHSQGATPAFLIADVKSSLVHRLILLEPAGPPFQEPATSNYTPARAWGLTDIPLTYSLPVKDPSIDFVKSVIKANSSKVEDCVLQADSPAPRQLINLKTIEILVITAEASWHVMYDWCTVKFLRQAGVTASHISLGDVGVKGNGHMFFLETNSDESARILQEWIEVSGQS